MAAPRRSRLLLALFVAGSVVALALVVALGRWQSTPPAPPAERPDPRLVYAGPYRNVHPAAAYVGDADCAVCHHEQAESFRRHPMGRSILPAADPAQRALEAGHHNPFAALGSEFRIERDGDRLRHRVVRRDDAGQVIYETVFDVHYIVGSGNHGHSYLSDRAGFVVQTPVSWYSSKQIWDLAPGWTAVEGGRAILPECLFCHANRVEPIAGRLNRYAEPLFGSHAAIGCERCHGPGAAHAAAPVEPFTIVNPAKLEPRLRDAVCEQCHLEGEHRMVRRGRGLFDFRPGLPLQEFWAVFVDADLHNPNAVNHVEQMHRSRCFTASDGRLGCISCHDPHVKPAGEAGIAHFRDRCLKCHAQHGCSLPERERRQTSASDSCIACHMPPTPTADIAHTASTDHRVPRRPGARPAPSGRSTDGLPIRSFYPASSAEDERDLGVALAEMVRHGRAPERFARDALARLEAADPRDTEAHEARAHALRALARRREAADAFAAALALEPERESALLGAAELAMALGRNDEAIRLWKSAAALNPWRSQYQGNLALLLAAAGDWPGARTHAEACLRLDPARTEVRATLIEALLQTGDREAAGAHFALIEALKPGDLESLRRRFISRLRQTSGNRD